MNQKSKFIINVDVEYPEQFDAETVARIFIDYMNLNRFVIGTPKVDIFPKDATIDLVRNFDTNEKPLTH